jgi:hypothetical protein
MDAPMSQGVDLLRLLEPAVRPGGLPGAAKAPTPPMEQRDFEALLAEAQQDQAGAASEAPASDDGGAAHAAAPKAAPLAPLGQIDRIENRSLRALIGGK